MNKGIEWALKKARQELKEQGETYRDPRFSWDFDETGEIRRKTYEKACDQLRAVIKDLETASRVVIVPLGRSPL